MPVHRIDHVTLNSSDLAKTCAFYSDVLGFGVQPLEFGDIRAAWLTLDGHPFVHLISRAPEQAVDAYGLVDHFALEATGFTETRARLKSLGVASQENEVAAFNLRQIVVRDPDGVKVELNFRAHADLEV